MRRGLILIAAVLVAAVSLAGQGAPPASPLRLVSSAGTRAIPTIQNGDTELVALDDLTALFGVTVKEDAVARAFTVTYKGKTVVLSQNQALASISGRLVSMPASPAKISNRWYVPVEFIGRALSLVYDSPLELRKASRLVILGPLRVPRVVVHHDATAPQGRITIDLVPTVGHQVVQEATRLLIKLDADLLDLTLPQIQSQGFVTGVHPGEPPTTLVVELGPRFGSVKAADAPLDPDGTRITLDLFPAPESTSTPSPVAPGAPAAPAPSAPPGPGTRPSIPS